ncbi:MAG: sigma-70 family RNA polymerase sigma factor [Bacteroidales bacterium]|nr:sigma-70 family RNA polymerase sigma factor [Bacteroidales bacterium]
MTGYDEDIKKIIVLMQPKMVSAAMAVLHDYERSKDLVQDVTEVFWKHRRTFKRNVTDVESYMYRCVVNSSMKKLKADKAEAKLFVDIDVAMFVADDSCDTDYDVYNARSVVVSEAMDKLEIKHKAMVEMYFCGSMSVNNIAKLLNVSPRKVRKILTESIEKIKNIVINNEMCYE